MKLIHLTGEIDLSLYSSPAYKNLVSELFRITKYKRNIFKRIGYDTCLKDRLTKEQLQILKDLSKSETKILLEILKLKNLNKSDLETITH